jgi:hypothetical protein
MGTVVFVVVVVGVLGLVLAVGASLVVLTFVTARRLVRGRRRATAAAGLAVVLSVVAAALALTFGGAPAYSGTACLRHAPEWFGEGSWTQGTGLWPPGLRCTFEWRGQVGTYEDGFDALWVAVAFTAVFGASMGVLVASAPYARRRLGLAPISSDVGPSDR